MRLVKLFSCLTWYFLPQHQSSNLFFFLSSSFYPSFLYDNNQIRCIYRIIIEIHLTPSLSLISSEVYDLPVWCCPSIWLSACWKGVETIRKIRKVINTKWVTQKDFSLFKDSTLLHVGCAMRSIWSLLAGEDVKMLNCTNSIYLFEMSIFLNVPK